MRIKQFKVKLDKDGSLKPLEPIDAIPDEEGIVIFVDKNDVLIDDSKSVLSEIVLRKVWDNKEDDIYNEV